MQKTILAIEDEDVIRVMLGRMLRGYKVIAVGSLSEGRKAIVERQVEIDLVLADIQLGDGYSPDLHSTVSPILEAHRIRWLAMTGDAQTEHLKYYRDRKIDVLEKPFRPKDLLAAIEATFNRPWPTE